jgi:hypothetical protein
MDNLQYSRPIDVHRMSEYPEVQRVITFLLSHLKEAVLIKGSPRDKVLRHLKVVVLDLYIAYLGDPLVYVGYPRGSDAYQSGTRLRKLHLGLDSMKKVVDSLSTLGYLEDHRGIYDRDRETGFNSRMRATPRLIDLIDNNDVASSMIARVDDDVIVLREKIAKEDGGGKRELSFDDTDEIVRMREELCSYNTFLQSHKLGLSLPVKEVESNLIARRCAAIDYTRNRLYRIFNGDFSSGGRFYRGWWQNIPRDLRKYITIDGEPCSELDYSGQHLLLLYARGQDEYVWLKGLDDDPYYLEKYGGEVRDLLKVAILILVNETDRQKVVRAIRKKINYDFPDLQSTDAFINPLIDELMEKHPIVRQHFFSGSGSALQYQDSQIAEYVLKNMQAHGYVALPIHDSFVTQDKHLAQLYSLMKEAYRMLGVESIPHITIKKGANTTFKESYFKPLWEQMDKERALKQNELADLKRLENLPESS